MLRDNHGRNIGYARIAITDKCNLRCRYCMPENAIFLDKKEILSFEEIIRLLKILASQGIRKIRYTGGEPFMRKDFIDLLHATTSQTHIPHISITTNGTLTQPYISQLKALNIHSVNVSLDSLHAPKIFRITRRNMFDEVFSTIEMLLKYGITTKINVVVMEDINTDEIIDFIKITKEMPLSVRFIEEMPFNHQIAKPLLWDYIHILKHIQTHFNIEPLPNMPHSTAINYKIKNFVGSFGIIPSYTRSFCNTCNRIRITPQGFLKTCLYEKQEFALLPLLREKAMTDNQIAICIQDFILKKPLNGFEAEKQSNDTLETMNKIGG